jgi:tRNA-modifying protein YgfZ
MAPIILSGPHEVQTGLRRDSFTSMHRKRNADRVMNAPTVDVEELDALEQQRAFVDLSDWRKVVVSGADAVRWLNDLLSADVAVLTPGGARRSLLLTPTGRIRADVHVARRENDVVLLQSPDQPDHVGLALHPYTLSSDVELHDATQELSLIAVPGHASTLVGHPGHTPSVLGPGVDIVPASGKPSWHVGDALVKAGLVEAGDGAVDVWRIRRGIARMGVDFDEDALPAEAALEDAIAFDKGCFLGQESVAKVRNLGHPPRVLRHMTVESELDAGAAVRSGASRVGHVTSAAPLGTRSVCIVRVAWHAVDAPLSLEDGRTLEPVPRLS